jgi:hypothetical protein
MYGIDGFLKGFCLQGHLLEKQDKIILDDLIQQNQHFHFELEIEQHGEAIPEGNYMLCPQLLDQETGLLVLRLPLAVGPLPRAGLQVVDSHLTEGKMQGAGYGGCNKGYQL